MKNLELDLSFTETMPNLWDTYELVLLTYGTEASETEFGQIMWGAGFRNLDTPALYRDFKWYFMCARPERIRRKKD